MLVDISSRGKSSTTRFLHKYLLLESHVMELISTCQGSAYARIDGAFTHVRYGEEVYKVDIFVAVVYSCRTDSPVTFLTLTSLYIF